MVLRAVPFAVVCGAAASSAWAVPLARVPQTVAAISVAAPADDPVGAHAAIAEAQERLAEVDATVSVLQEDAEKLEGAVRQRARNAVAGLRTIRDSYRKDVDELVAQARQMTLGQLAAARAALTRRWTTFEQTLDGYVAEVKLDIHQRKALIQARIKAEQAYWQAALTDVRAKAATLTARERVAIEARIARMSARVDEAETRLTKLRNAGHSAWSALKQDFVNSRQILDEAYRDPR